MTDFSTCCGKPVHIEWDNKNEEPCAKLERLFGLVGLDFQNDETNAQFFDSIFTLIEKQNAAEREAKIALLMELDAKMLEYRMEKESIESAWNFLCFFIHEKLDFYKNNEHN